MRTKNGVTIWITLKSIELFTDLDKLNLVKFGYGGLVLGSN